MVRHLFADKNEEFIHAQVNALMYSLDIDSNVRGKRPMPERFRELDDYWNESQGNVIQETALPAPGDWASEYQQKYNHGDAWAGEFLNNKAFSGVRPEQWTNESATERQQNRAVDDQWVDEFSNLRVNNWAEEFVPKYR
ncbi:hypothetical protein RYX36_013464 [Vicia faba]